MLCDILVCEGFQGHIKHVGGRNDKLGEIQMFIKQGPRALEIEAAVVRRSEMLTEINS